MVEAVAMGSTSDEMVTAALAESTGPAKAAKAAASSSAGTGSTAKAQAVANLVGLLEQSRQNDNNSFEQQLTNVRKDRELKKKEAARLQKEVKKIDQKRRRVQKHCEKASTEELLEVLRVRTLRAEKKEKASASTD